MRARRVYALVRRALDHEPAERSAFLREALKGAPDLLAEAEGLVAEALETGGLPRWEAAGAEKRPALLQPGQHVAAFRVVELIGRGGMSEVYRAERDTGFDQVVAIKVMKGGPAGELEPRFLNERQILATLDHPNIAKLFDGGTTDDGLPYFAMELVEGRRIDEHCDAERLTVGARLRLVETVCRAVDFAHRRLIVHRDLKPSNVMVTAAGLVKLLDFGIAKLLGDGAEAADGLTATDQRWMTLDFASPEQVRGEPVTPASDVYSLGVLLYGLVAGRSPYSSDGKLLLRRMREVSDGPTVPPSLALKEPATGSHGPSARQVAEVRSTQPGALRRRLAGDVDRIVLKAMEKEPERRYASARELADDLARHLDGRPVMARGDSHLYRARKFARRHWVGVALSAALTLSALGFGTALVLQGIRAARERDRAEAVLTFLEQTLGAPSPFSGQGAEVKLADVLSGIADPSRPEGSFGDLPPLVRADIDHLVGRVFRQLGQYDEAGRHLESALRLRQAYTGPRDPSVAETTLELGFLAKQLERFDEAETLMRQALGILGSVEGPGDRGRSSSASRRLEITEALTFLGDLLVARGDFDEAEELFRRSLAIRRRYAERSASVAENLNNLGHLAYRRGRLPEAQRYVLEALEMRRALPSVREIDLAQSYTMLALVYSGQRRHEEALELHSKALSIRRSSLGARHVLALESEHNVGSTRLRLGLADATTQAHLMSALEGRRQVFGASHSTVAQSASALGRLHLARSEWAQAEEKFEESLDILGRSGGDRTPEGIVRTYLARALAGQARSEECAAQARRALVSLESHPRRSEALSAFEACGSEAAAPATAGHAGPKR